MDVTRTCNKCNHKFRDSSTLRRHQARLTPCVMDTIVGKKEANRPAALHETWYFHFHNGCNLEVKKDPTLVEMNGTIKISVCVKGEQLYSARELLYLYEAHTHKTFRLSEFCSEKTFQDPATLIQQLASAIMPTESKINVPLLAILQLTSDKIRARIAESWSCAAYDTLVDVSEARCIMSSCVKEEFHCQSGKLYRDEAIEQLTQILAPRRMPIKDATDLIKLQRYYRARFGDEKMWQIMRGGRQKDVFYDAVEAGLLKAMTLLKEWGAPNFNGDEGGESRYDKAFLRAAESGQIQAMILLKNWGAKNFDEALVEAARYNQVEAIPTLYTCGAINFEEAIDEAERHGNYEVMILLADMIDPAEEALRKSLISLKPVIEHLPQSRE